MSQTFSIDIHDGSVLRNRIDLLNTFKDFYPQAKISLFFIPYDYELEMSPSFSLTRKQKLDWLHKNSDWIEIIPHGLIHIFGEFSGCDKQTMETYIGTVGDELKKDGLNSVEGFCAPNWLWTKEVVEALNEAKWWGAVDRNQPEMIRPTRYYEYTHSFTEPFYLDDGLEHIALHGHMTGPSDNDLEACFTNLFKIPRDAEFKFVSEIIKEQGKC